MSARGWTVLEALRWASHYMRTKKSTVDAAIEALRSEVGITTWQAGKVREALEREHQAIVKRRDAIARLRERVAIDAKEECRTQIYSVDDVQELLAAYEELGGE